MVYLESWEEFSSSVIDLYDSAPHSRYLAKYRHSDGLLVLKVTDGPTCLKFKTDKIQDLKRFDRLNRLIMARMMKRELPETPVVEPAVIAAPEIKKKGKKKR